MTVSYSQRDHFGTPQAVSNPFTDQNNMFTTKSSQEVPLSTSQPADHSSPITQRQVIVEQIQDSESPADDDPPPEPEVMTITPSSNE